MQPLKDSQIRAARALLGWSQADLAEKTCLGLSTIKRVENGDLITKATNLSIRKAFEEAGAVFFESADQIVGLDLIAGVALRNDK